MPFPNLQDGTPEEWNRKWEEMSPALLSPRCPEVVFRAQLKMLQKVRQGVQTLWAMEQEVDITELCQMQREITVAVLHREGFQREWVSATPALRQEHILIGLAKACSLDPEPTHRLNGARAFCAHELRLNHLGGDSSVFLDLLQCVLLDDHTVTPKTPRYVSHPFWDQMFAERAALNTTDLENQAVGKILVLRTKLICHVMQLTINSFLGIATPRKVNLSKADKLLIEPAWANAEAMLKPALEQLYGRKGSKVFLHESKRYMKGHLPRHEHHCTYPGCRKVELVDGSKFYLCKPCAEKAGRKFRYCSVFLSYFPPILPNQLTFPSRQCQRNDWKTRHKRMCGKPLDLETLSTHLPFTDPIDAPIQPTEYIEDPIGGFQRSEPLNILVAWLNLDPEVMYRLGDAENLARHLIFPEKPMSRHFFLLHRELAMATGHIRVVGVLAQYICWLAMSEGVEAKGFTPAVIVSRLASDFELNEGGLRRHVLLFQDMQKDDPHGKPFLLKGMSDTAWVKEYEYLATSDVVITFD
ncbi:hypothetical protein B0H16DRAFT_1608847 [Mycena metata]|uniref:Uncharacterized protein n=1 Tax=Mycena metata TaxID=1033252 RepID=A0AAD7HFH7_9AGAR|nr:hypothetical protein B0H16DRAFT_1608847 [Mycena metata]